MKRSDPDDEKYGYCLPALTGDYFLSMTSAEGKNDRRSRNQATASQPGGSFTIYHRGMKGPIGRIENAEHGIVCDNWDRDEYGPFRRVFFLPEAKVIAVLPISNDRVVLHRFDVDDALSKSGLVYLFVTSTPPKEIKAGTIMTYPIVVKSKNGGLLFKIDSGPTGMSVSKEGVVTWAVPSTDTGVQNIIFSVKDKTGQDTFHTCSIKVVK